MAETIGVIGGSGLYNLSSGEEKESVELDTPFGKPSSPVQRRIVNGNEVLFIARHGPGHVLTPSEVNYKANIWALKSLGASWCLGVGAVGSLQENIKPGDIVVPDQFIDRTKGRESTFFGKGVVGHVQFADPFCPILRKILLSVATTQVFEKKKGIHNKATYVCMEGPAFSTRAESRMYRSWQGSIIGMTAVTEAKLAREAEIAYATLATVTDYDCWRSESSDVDVAEILETLAGNTKAATLIIEKLAKELTGEVPSDMVGKALDVAIISDLAGAPAGTLKELEPILTRTIQARKES